MRRYTLLTACAVLLLAWGVFLVGLDDASMWFDEDFSWRLSRGNVVELLQLQYEEDVHPPLHYLSLLVWIDWTRSENLFVMRLTSAIFALLAVAATYRLAWIWLRSEWAAVGAAVFLATSGVFIFYARNLRMYPLLMFLAALSWWALTRLVKGQRGGIWSYGVSLAALAYTFYFAAFMVVAQIVVVLLFFRDRLKQVVFAGGIALLLFAPWLPVLVAQIGNEQLQTDDPNAPPIGKFLGTVPTSEDTIWRLVLKYSAEQPAFLVLLVVLAFGLAVQRRDTTRLWVIVAGIWFFLTVALFFAVNLVIPVYGLRYTLSVAPALALLVGAAVASLPTNTARLASVLVIGVFGIFVHRDGFPEEEVPHRDLLTTINERYREGDRIWYALEAGAYGSALDGPATYHLDFDAPRLHSDEFVWAAPVEYDTLDKAIRVWDVRPFWIAFPDGTEDPLKSQRVVTERYDFASYRVRLYEAPDPTQTAVSIGSLFEMKTSPPVQVEYLPGETVLAKTWWRATSAVDLDYSYVLQLRTAENEIVGQVDGGLTAGNNASPTSQWTVASEYALFTPDFSLPEGLPAGEYTLWLGVYHWQTPEERLTINDSDELTPIAAFLVAT